MTYGTSQPRVARVEMEPKHADIDGLFYGVGTVIGGRAGLGGGLAGCDPARRRVKLNADVSGTDNVATAPAGRYRDVTTDRVRRHSRNRCLAGGAAQITNAPSTNNVAPKAASEETANNVRPCGFVAATCQIHRTDRRKIAAPRTPSKTATRHQTRGRGKASGRAAQRWADKRRFQQPREQELERTKKVGK